MDSAFKDLKSLFKSKATPHVDSIVFQLYYKFTMGLLLISALLITGTQFFGEPINCLYNSDSFPKNFINTFCWIEGTFIVRTHLNKEVGKEVTSHGVGPFVEGRDEKITITYYQFVPFVLTAQSIMFYLPRYLWRISEGARLKTLLMGLTKEKTLLLKQEDEQKWIQNLATVLYRYLNTHNFWAVKYFICEALNPVILIINILITNKFLGNQFIYLGQQVIEYGLDSNGTSPLTKVFPLMTKCLITPAGPSGTVEKHDALCILALNIVNEKVYLILWFWYWLLLAVTHIAVFWRIAEILSPEIRGKLMLSATRYKNKGIIDDLMDRISIGDWLMLIHMRPYINSLMYENVLARLHKLILQNQPQQNGPRDPEGAYPKLSGHVDQES